jgi:hypothetical protein
MSVPDPDPASVPPAKARIRLDLEPDVRRRLRLAATRREQSMAEFCRCAVTELVDQLEPPGHTRCPTTRL